MAIAILLLIGAGVARWVTVDGEDGEAERPPQVGFNNNAVTQGVASPTQAAKLLAGAGATVDRVQINWASIEPAAGEFDLSVPDAIYRADLRQGVRPLFVFGFAPAWANGGLCDSRVANCHFPPTPEHYDDAARTVAMLAERYPRLAGIEIWNEPNTAYFWSPAADPDAYTALLETSYEAIKRAEATMPVAGASLSSTPGTAPGDIVAEDFLARLYELGGASSMDALSVHPYAEQQDLEGDSAIELVSDLTTLGDGAGDEATPIWATETGMTRTGALPVSPEDQAEAVANLSARLAELDRVEMVLIHTLAEAPGSIANPERGFGVLDAGLNPLPAYCALASAWDGSARGCPA